MSTKTKRTEHGYAIIPAAPGYRVARGNARDRSRRDLVIYPVIAWAVPRDSGEGYAIPISPDGWTNGEHPFAVLGPDGEIITDSWPLGSRNLDEWAKDCATWHEEEKEEKQRAAGESELEPA